MIFVNNSTHSSARIARRSPEVHHARRSRQASDVRKCHIGVPAAQDLLPQLKLASLTATLHLALQPLSVAHTEAANSTLILMDFRGRAGTVSLRCLPDARPRPEVITACSCLRRFLQDRLSFEIIAFL